MRKLLLGSMILALVASLPLAAEEVTATINFEGPPAGTIVSSIDGDSTGGAVGPVVVFGVNPLFPGSNAAMIFDSDVPTGGDTDLGTPNETCLGGGPGHGIGGEAGKTFENCVPLHNVLIISEDLDTTDPDDADLRGTSFSFDFSGLSYPFVPDDVTIFSLTIMDVENVEGPASIVLYDAMDNVLGTFLTPVTGDNGVATVLTGAPGVGTSGVSRMEVVLQGSAAIDNLVFSISREEEMGGEGCTPGYWKNHTENWVGFAPSDLIGGVFADANDPVLGIGANTLLEGLSFHGGGGAAGGARILAREAIAALLNAASPDVGFDLTLMEIIDAANTAFASGDRATMLSLASQLNALNNAGCPLN